MFQEKSVVFLLTEIVDIWSEPVIEEALSEDHSHVGAVVYPPEFDTSTNEEEGPYDVTRTDEIQDVKGTLEIHYQSTKALGNKSILTHSLQYLLVTKRKSPKKCCLTSDHSDWTKTHATNTKLSTKRNQEQIKMRNLSTRLHLSSPTQLHLKINSDN